jgi:hypothetical protein
MRRLAVLLLMLTAAGCGGGPDADALKKGVGERLAQALPEGAVSLAAFERRGSQSDTKAPAGEMRRILYFDAELKLERDFDFGAWDAPGVAGLVSALGAGPKGITGISSGGNKAGDVLRAHGTALYKRDGDRWLDVASGGYRPATAPAYATNAPQGAAAILEAMRKVIDSVPRDAAPAQRAVIEEELGVAYATIRARLARATDGYAIAAGPEHGQYLRFAQALADGEGARMVPLITAAARRTCGCCAKARCRSRSRRATPRSTPTPARGISPRTGRTPRCAPSAASTPSRCTSWRAPRAPRRRWRISGAGGSRSASTARRRAPRPCACSKRTGSASRTSSRSSSRSAMRWSRCGRRKRMPSSR